MFHASKPDSSRIEKRALRWRRRDFAKRSSQMLGAACALGRRRHNRGPRVVLFKRFAASSCHRSVTETMTQRYFERRAILPVIAAFMGAFCASEVPAQMTGLNPTAAEISQLPKFCWDQMGVANAQGDQYRPLNCGPGTNHSCPGLVTLLRAKRERDSRKRSAMLGTAATDVQYTQQ